MKNVILLIAILTTAACATQRYGRAQSLSGNEENMLGCDQVRLEIVKAESFLTDLRIQRSDVNIAHIAGFLGDFGLGNAIEGDAAQNSGEIRLQQLKALKAEKQCF